MRSLKELERDVRQFLITLANVRKVEVKAFSGTKGQKKVEVTAFICPDTRENRNRVYLTEQYLMERHRNVLFEFHCHPHRLKETDEQESTLEAAN